MAKLQNRALFSKSYMVPGLCSLPGRHFWALFDAEMVFCPVRDHFWADFDAELVFFPVRRQFWALFDAEMRRGGNKITLPGMAG